MLQDDLSQAIIELEEYHNQVQLLEQRNRELVQDRSKMMNNDRDWESKYRVLKSKIARKVVEDSGLTLTDGKSKRFHRPFDTLPTLTDGNCMVDAILRSMGSPGNSSRVCEMVRRNAYLIAMGSNPSISILRSNYTGNHLSSSWADKMSEFVKPGTWLDHTHLLVLQVVFDIQVRIHCPPAVATFADAISILDGRPIIDLVYAQNHYLGTTCPSASLSLRPGWTVYGSRYHGNTTFQYLFGGSVVHMAIYLRLYS